MTPPELKKFVEVGMVWALSGSPCFDCGGEVKTTGKGLWSDDVDWPCSKCPKVWKPKEIAEILQKNVETLGEVEGTKRVMPKPRPTPMPSSGERLTK